MESLFILLSFFSITWILMLSSILDRPRDYLTSKSVFFYKLFNCPFCVGFHTGYIFYMLYNPFDSWSIKMMALWALASAAFNYILYIEVVGFSRF